MMVRVRCLSEDHNEAEFNQEGAHAEAQADEWLRRLCLQAPATKSFEWMVEVEVVLEDGSHVLSEVAMEHGRQPRPLRDVLVEQLHEMVSSFEWGRLRREEALRQGEWLRGEAFRDPYSRMLRHLRTRRKDGKPSATRPGRDDPIFGPGLMHSPFATARGVGA